MVDHVPSILVLLNDERSVQQETQVPQKRRGIADENLIRNENYDDEHVPRVVVVRSGTIETVPAALFVVAALVAVAVLVVALAVRVVDRVADREVLAVPAVKQAMLAVAGAVTAPVVDECVAWNALRDCVTVLVEAGHVATLVVVVVAQVGIAFRLQKTEYTLKQLRKDEMYLEVISFNVSYPDEHIHWTDVGPIHAKQSLSGTEGTTMGPNKYNCLGYCLN